MAKDNRIKFSSTLYKLTSKFRIILEKTISRKLYLAIFTFHLFILGIVFLVIHNIDSFLNYNLTGGVVGFTYIWTIRPIVLLFNWLVSKINILDFDYIGFSFLHLIIPPYFLIGSVWLQFRKKELTVRYLIVSILITWIILMILSLLLFPHQYVEGY